MQPDVGSDPARVQTSAVPTEDGSGYIINGRKLWATNGAIADIVERHEALDGLWHLSAEPIAKQPLSIHRAPVNVNTDSGGDGGFIHAETTIAVNPTNPNNIVMVSNVGHREAGLTAGMLEAVSFDGGATWTRHLIGSNDNLGSACCDPSLSFDRYGNLFLTYLFQTENTVPVALSRDGGQPGAPAPDDPMHRGDGPDGSGQPRKQLNYGRPGEGAH